MLLRAERYVRVTAPQGSFQGRRVCQRKLCAARNHICNALDILKAKSAASHAGHPLL
jgi:hypothetical protein